MKQYSYLVALILTASPFFEAVADAASHRQAAEAFYSVAVVDDPEKVADVVTEMIAQLQPELRAHQEILRDFGRKIVSSKRYKDSRVKVYQDLMNEEELRALTELFRQPEYQRYLAVRAEIVRRNAEETVKLFKDEFPELIRRINANSQTADPADR